MFIGCQKEKEIMTVFVVQEVEETFGSKHILSAEKYGDLELWTFCFLWRTISK